MPGERTWEKGGAKQDTYILQIDITWSRKISSHFKMQRWHWLLSQLKTSIRWVSFHFCCKIILGLLCKRQSVQEFWEQRSLVGSESTVSLANNLRMRTDKCYQPDGNWLLYKGRDCKDHCSVSMKAAWSNFTTTQILYINWMWGWSLCHLRINC